MAGPEQNDRADELKHGHVAWLSEPMPRHPEQIRCLACSHYCRLGEGEIGKCGIRQVTAGKLRLNTYALPAALHVDPIEKKPLYHVLPGSPILSLGTVGCNLSCKFCQNADISQYPQTHGGKVFGRHLAPADAVAAAQRAGCHAIAYTYNEPTVFFEYAHDIGVLARAAGMKNVFVSSGFESQEALDAALPFLDAANVDIKGFTKRFYKEVCGALLNPVLNAVRHLHERGVWVEVTTLVIPGENDSDDELRGIAEFVASVSRDMPWHLSAFHPDYQMLDKPRTPIATIERAMRIGRDAGLRFVYGGNIDRPELHSTRCPGCDAMLIERNGHIGHHVRLVGVTPEGKCRRCGYQLPGIFTLNARAPRAATPAPLAAALH